MKSGSTQRYIHPGAATIFLFVIASCAALSISVRADAVTDWDVIAFKAVEASGRTDPDTSCFIAMAHLAMHDALNAIDRRYEPYAYKAAAPHGASPEAAVAVAAHGVLIAKIPGQKKALDAELARALSAIPDSESRAEGLLVGRAAAAAILARRENDGTDSVTQYTPGEELGVWRPTPPDFLPPAGVGFRKVKPFTMTSATQFGPSRPEYFNLSSAEYAADYNEVKKIGAANSATRTAEQSEIARFWYEPSPGAHIRLARDLVRVRNLDLWESARLFALLHMACADSLIAGYDAKYHFNFWRPVTAIPLGENDGNPQTAGDPSWKPYLVTPNHPDYLSLHAVLAAAWAEVMAGFFGTDRVTFTVKSAARYPGLKRSFTSFSKSAQEAADSRIYGGIHFRTSCKDGLVVGRKIGAQAYAKYLQPVSEDYPPASLEPTLAKSER